MPSFFIALFVACLQVKFIFIINKLIMNSSQLLYKISNLKYSIRKKEAEYSNAVKTNDQLNIRQHYEALALLQSDLDAAMKAFHTVPAEPAANQPAEKKKTKRWQNFFNLRTWRKV
jgi:hypothetical protein